MTFSMNYYLTDELKNALYDIVMGLYPDCKLSAEEISLQHPKEMGHGDYATTIALSLGKILGKNPIEIAQHIADALQSHISALEAGEVDQTSEQRDQITTKFEIRNSKFENKKQNKKISYIIDRVQMVAPGFINLWLNQQFLITQMQQVLEGDLVHSDDKKVILNLPKSSKKQQIMVEFTDPNPFKEFHIGHLYSTTVGESICRLLEAMGHTVKRADYFGDVGMHVAKCLYGILQSQKSKVKSQKLLEELEGKPLEERIKFLGQCYAVGATAYEEDDAAKEQMKKLNFLIYIANQRRMQDENNWQPQIDYMAHIKDIDEDELAAVRMLYETGRRWSLEYFEEQYKRLDTGFAASKKEGEQAFDYYYPEGVVGEYGIKLVRAHIKDGIFEEHEGAIVYRGERVGLHTRVFINSLGLPTYEAKELGLAPTKYKDYPYDRSLIITGNEIKEYFKVLLAAMKDVEPQLGNITQHLSHGMVRLPEGKMSSRTGKIVTAAQLLDESKRKIQDSEFRIQNEKGEKMPIPGQLAEAVAVGAIKYALLKNTIGGDVIFNMEESVSFEGNSGPYLQYTYARTCSVLRKSETRNSKSEINSNNQNSKNFELRTSNFELNNEELVVLRLLYRFSEVVVEAATSYSPNVVCSYLYDLAGAFNTFYAKHSILQEQNEVKSQKSKVKSKNEEEKSVSVPNTNSEFRLFLTSAVGHTIKNGLYLLGIPALEKM